MAKHFTTFHESVIMVWFLGNWLIFLSLSSNEWWKWQNRWMKIFFKKKPDLKFWVLNNTLTKPVLCFFCLVKMLNSFAQKCWEKNIPCSDKSYVNNFRHNRKNRTPIARIEKSFDGLHQQYFVQFHLTWPIRFVENLFLQFVLLCRALNTYNSYQLKPSSVILLIRLVNWKSISE